jgi:hypothetical protein
MNPSRRLIVSGLLVASPMFAAAHREGGDSSKFVSQKLTLRGEGGQSLFLSTTAMEDFPVQSPPEIPIIRQSGDIVRTLRGYTGSRMTDILDRSGLAPSDHNILKRLVIVATASDDYKAVFSWNELYNTSVGSGVLILYAKDGKPLDDSEGRFALVSTMDRHTGPRHVRWLSDVQVQKIA